VLVAMLWKTYASRMAAGDGSSLATVTCPVDVRRVLAGLARNYFGCALSFASAEREFASLQGASVGELALAVHNSVQRIKPDFALNAFRTLGRFRRERGLAALESIHLRHPSAA